MRLLPLFRYLRTAVTLCAGMAAGFVFFYRLPVLIGVCLYKEAAPKL